MFTASRPVDHPFFRVTKDKEGARETARCLCSQWWKSPSDSSSNQGWLHSCWWKRIPLLKAERIEVQFPQNICLTSSLCFYSTAVTGINWQVMWEKAEQTLPVTADLLLVSKLLWLRICSLEVKCTSCHFSKGKIIPAWICFFFISVIYSAQSLHIARMLRINVPLVSTNVWIPALYKHIQLYYPTLTIQKSTLNCDLNWFMMIDFCIVFVGIL